MSTKVITDPSALGWEQDGATANGTPIYKWAEGADNEHPIVDGDTEGQVTTWDGAKWTPDSSLTIDGSGNATLKGNVTLDRPSGGCYQDFKSDSGHYRAGLNSIGNYYVWDVVNSADRLTIDASGNVGIGRSDPQTRLHVNESSSDVQIRVNSGVSASSTFQSSNSDRAWRSGVESGGSYVIRDVTSATDRLTIDSSGNATFTAGGNSTSLSGNRIDFSRNNYNFISANAGSDSHIRFEVNNKQALELDPSGDATFSGTVNANKFVGDGSGLTGVGGGLPPGDFTHNGKITATDFIATSDERVKDNITTAPVGLIDSLKGREWEWKESGEKGSGVVAQELEQVLPHLVHTDDDGMKSVAYNGLVAYLIEEVKALRAEVEALK